MRSKKTLIENPEHIERTVLRPQVEEFSDIYMGVNGFDSYVLKQVSYLSKAGYADVYFYKTDGTYELLKVRMSIAWSPLKLEYMVSKPTFTIKTGKIK
jgi:hypothetical protein